MGRGSENDIVLDSGSVSTKHAVMKRVDGGYELLDLGSTNGIRSKGQRQTKVPLVSGMILQLGEVSFDFTLTDEERKALASEKPMLPPIEEEAETKPEPEKKKAKKKEEEPKVYETASASSGVGFVSVLLFLVFAALVFVVGAGLRYQKDTGESLLKAMGTKKTAEQVVPAQAE